MIALDLVRRWSEEECQFGSSLVTRPGQLSAACRAWAEVRGEPPVTASAFHAALICFKGIKYGQDTKKTRVVRGVALVRQETPSVAA